MTTHKPQVPAAPQSTAEPQPSPRLTAEERAKARRLCDRMLAQSCGDGACYWTRPTGMGTNGGCRCTTYVRSTAFPTAVRALVRALADLEAVERERDEARADTGDGLVIGEMLLATERKRVADAIAERDAARAQIADAEALNAKLRAEVGRQKEAVQQLAVQLDENANSPWLAPYDARMLRAQVAGLEQELKSVQSKTAALAEALRWYADDSNWHPEWHEAELAKAALTQVGLGPEDTP